MFDTITGRLSALKATLPAQAQLIAVSKGQSAATIGEALAAGHRLFGENRVQEAAEKWPALKAACPDAALHLIGPLQTNKVKTALQLFDAIHSLDRPALADALAQAGCILPCFVQVNTGKEPQKSGVAPENADTFIAYARSKKLNVTGLMCVPPAEEDPAPHFDLLRTIAKRNGLSQLSMGMSRDYRIALDHGATHVRIGTAIFGRR